MTLGMAPPGGAVSLFNGRDLGNWHRRDGSPAQWAVADGVMTVVRGGGDIVSDATHRDAWIHVEFCLADMPDKTGQGKSNSGVFIQGRYEVQVLDSSGWSAPGLGDCGAIYNQFSPLENACLPALRWQTYDVWFRAARLDEAGGLISNARLTVLLNGRPIHNNIETLGITGAAVDDRVGEPGPLLLQDHGDPVQYRNVWMLPLAEAGSSDYGPR